VSNVSCSTRGGCVGTPEPKGRAGSSSCSPPTDAGLRFQSRFNGGCSAPGSLNFRAAKVSSACGRTAATRSKSRIRTLATLPLGRNTGSRTGAALHALAHHHSRDRTAFRAVLTMGITAPNSWLGPWSALRGSALRCRPGVPRVFAPHRPARPSRRAFSQFEEFSRTMRSIQ